MGLFGRKKKVRFETITVENETRVFNSLESKGYVLCTEPFQFDVEKSHQKLRKDAMSMAKDMHAELLVEVWDPIFNHMHWKGLKYAVWRKATPKELEEKSKEKEKTHRPDYSDSMGSYDELQKKIEMKKLQVAQEDLKYFETSVKSEKVEEEDSRMGGPEDEIGMVSEKIEVRSSYDPYDHQGESADDPQDDIIDKQAASSGPVFETDMKLEFGEAPTDDPTKEIDPLSMMMDAAGDESKTGDPMQEVPAGPPGPPPPVPTAPKQEKEEEEGQ